MLFRSAINAAGIGAGRRSIRAYLANRNLLLSEAQVRKVLLELSQMGLVSVERGRGGVRLTQQGILLTGQRPGY